MKTCLSIVKYAVDEDSLGGKDDCRTLIEGTRSPASYVPMPQQNFGAFRVCCGIGSLESARVHRGQKSLTVYRRSSRKGREKKGDSSQSCEGAPRIPFSCVHSFEKHLLQSITRRRRSALIKRHSLDSSTTSNRRHTLESGVLFRANVKHPEDASYDT